MTKKSPPLPWYRQPIGMGLLGLALMVAGWKLSTFVPLTPHELDQEDRLAELRRLAGEGPLGDRLDSFARHVRRIPPYQLPGRLMVLAGLVLFVAAGVRMYQAPARTEVPEEEPGEPASTGGRYLPE